ncbi:MAG TPA: hypothetical protein DEQ02_08490 [Ruminococcaceae bacterium]|nr:hypothetical protein [Oscillospiraceae bacterium]
MPYVPKEAYDTQVNRGYVVKLPEDQDYRVRAEIEIKDSYSAASFNSSMVNDVSYNFSMVNRTPSLNSFITTVSGSTFEFYHNLGYYRDIMTEYQNDAIDILLSVKYRLDTKKQEKTRGTDAFFDGTNTVYVYENPLFLPLGFTYDHYITKEDFLSLPEERRPEVLLRAVVVDDADSVEDRLNPLPESDTRDSTNETLNEDVSLRKEESSRVFSRDSGGFRSVIVANSKKYAYFSVPFDKGWSAKVNGQKTEITNSSGMMIVPVEKGENNIEFSFMPQGLLPGIGVSVISLLGILLYVYHYKRAKSAKL